MKIYRNSLIFFLITLASCSTNTDEELRLQIQSLISKDIREISHKALDQLTLGLGSSLLNITISKTDQESLISSFIMPHIEEELKKKKSNELKLLANGDISDRMGVIGSCILNNKGAIIEEIKTKNKILDPLADEIINELISCTNDLKIK